MDLIGPTEGKKDQCKRTKNLQEENQKNGEFIRKRVP